MFLGDSGAVRILCVGDSLTWGLGGRSYPEQLEEILNAQGGATRFKVFNGGNPGFNTREVADSLEETLAGYRPDFVIAQVGINDSWNIMSDEPAEPIDRLRLVRFFKAAGFVWERRKNKRFLAELSEESGPIELENIGGDVSAALRAFKERADSAGTRADVIAAYLAQDDDAQAQEQWELAKNRNLSGKLAAAEVRLHLRAGRLRQARAAAEAVASRFPDSTELLEAHAEVLSRLWDLPKLKELLNQAEKRGALKRSDVLSGLAAAGVSIPAGDYASFRILNALRRRPASPYLNMLWIKSRYLNGEAHAALALLSRFKSGGGAHTAGKLAAHRLYALFFDGRSEEALKEAASAVKKFPRSQAVYSAASNIRLRGGDCAGALLWAQKGLALWPTQDRLGLAAVSAYRCLGKKGEAEKINALLRERGVPEAFTPTSEPVDSAGLRAQKAAVSKIAAVVEEHGAKLLFMSYADLSYESIESEARRLGVSYMDLRPDFRRRFPSSKEYQAGDGMHYNTEGYRLVAQAAADWVRESSKALAPIGAEATD